MIQTQYLYMSYVLSSATSITGNKQIKLYEV